MLKRNPIKQKLAKEILSEADDYDFLGEGGLGEAYYFIITDNLKIKSTVLKSGEYVLKIQKRSADYYDEDNIKYLNTLSSKKLIPRIYYIDKEIMISDYKGESLYYILKNNKKYNLDKIFYNIGKELSKWKKSDFTHGDLSDCNIVIDDKNNVTFIDPIYHPFVSEHGFSNTDLFDLFKYAFVFTFMFPDDIEYYKNIIKDSFDEEFLKNPRKRKR